MKLWLKTLHRHFIPSEDNAYQPHFLRWRIAAGILSLVIAIEGLYLAHTFFIFPTNDYFAAVFASVLVDQTNQKRSEESLVTLTPNAKLEEAAQLKANDMAQKGYFAHNAPDGKTPWYWFEQVGYDYAAAGENLAVNFTDSTDVTDAWMHSPTHRANIMNRNYTEIGIATARGIYKGKEAIFVVQEFGRPSIVAREIDSASQLAQKLTTTQAVPPPTPVLSKTPVAKPTVVATKPAAPAAERSPALANEEVIAPTTAPSTTVAGAETKKLDIVEDTAVTAPILEHKDVSSLDLLLASPRQVTSNIYFFIALLLTLALGLAVFIKVRIQHVHIIGNGVLLIAITFSLIVLNAVLGLTQGAI